MNTQTPNSAMHVFEQPLADSSVIRWVAIDRPDADNLEYLKEHFAFHVLDFQDIMLPTHRSKMSKYKNYTFIVMLFPVYNQKTRQVTTAEVDFFLGPDYLITVQHNDIPALSELVQVCKQSPKTLHSITKDSPQHLLYRIIQRLLQSSYPMLDHIDLEIQELEDKIFSRGGEQLVQEILHMRHAIIDTRKIMQPHRSMLFKLKKAHFEIGDPHDDYFDDLLDHTQEIWNQLESYKESVDALHETNGSLISYRTNEVIKTLTVVSVVLLPATVVSSIFGMNAGNIPFVGHHSDFFIMLAIIFGAIIVTLLYIRRKKLW